MANEFPQNEQGPRLEAHQVILEPIITEKSTHQSQHRHAYPFRVNQWASKLQIKAAAEELFHVHVAKVRTANYSGKKRRYRFRVGKMGNWKKAIITLHPDSPAIEFF
jgi:large subunit ribosomal protein L23